MATEPIEPLSLFPTEAPEPHPVEPNAGHLVAAWCQAWSANHGGAQPDASVVRRVAGICRNIAKDRTDLDSWRAAWRAAQAAGCKGRYDIVTELADPAVARAGRENHFLGIARELASPAPGLASVTPLRQVGS